MVIPGIYIRLARQAAGLTQDELAFMLGKNKSTISRFEHGTLTPDAATLRDIARILGTTVPALYGNEPIDDPD